MKKLEHTLDSREADLATLSQRKAVNLSPTS